jgi:hypothetical protein
MASSDSKQGGFTVNDRRSFAGADERKPAPEKTDSVVVGPADTTPMGAGGDSDATATDPTGLPAVDFHTFVLSLGSSALLHLGELEHPDGGEVEKDLPLAKHTIDILAMLQDKTKGNLTSAEDKLMESLLYDLRLRYVNASK